MSLTAVRDKETWSGTRCWYGVASLAKEREHLEQSKVAAQASLVDGKASKWKERDKQSKKDMNN